MNKQAPIEDMAILQKEKSEICISIILPVHHLFTGQKIEDLEMEQCIRITRDKLSGQYDESRISSLIQDLTNLYQQIEITDHIQGIGLFVSSNVKKIIYFFLQVNLSVTIDRVFNIREIIYEYNYIIPYEVLLLSKKEVRLFHAKHYELTEIKDNVFPQKYKSDYEYSYPSRGSSTVGESVLQAFEKDKSLLEEVRLSSFYRELTKYLPAYLKPFTPLIIAGEVKDLSCFNRMTNDHWNIAGEINGNYMHYTTHELGTLTWKYMKQYIDRCRKELIEYVHEQHGKNMTVTGGLNIWRAVMEGRGQRLLVEKDYCLPGFFGNKDEEELDPGPFQHLHHMIPDVINLLIYLVLQKDGEIIIVENDELKDFNRLVLITRY